MDFNAFTYLQIPLRMYKSIGSPSAQSRVDSEMTNCEFKTSNYGFNSLDKLRLAVVRNYVYNSENMVNP